MGAPWELVGSGPCPLMGSLEHRLHQSLGTARHTVLPLQFLFRINCRYLTTGRFQMEME